MSTVDLLQEALRRARAAGYRIREDWLDGSPGGACVIKGQKWLFLDPLQPPHDQLEIVLAVLESEAAQASTVEGTNRHAA